MVYIYISLNSIFGLTLAVFDRSQCYTDSNYSLKVVDGEPNYTLEKSMNNCECFNIFQYIWIDLIGDKLWNFIEYFDFEPRKVPRKIR